MKIVVVEDNRVVGAKLIAMIKRMGHHALLAEDGEQGVLMWQRERPDLVLMDAMMPVVDGYSAARRIRSLEVEEWTPIIFLSAAEADQDIEKGIDAGGDDYLVKPVSYVVLHAKIRAMQRIDEMRRKLRAMTASLAAANRELERLSNEDGLTGLSNRRCFDEALRRSARDALFAEAPLSLLMIDVDSFKNYNDARGHRAGDECLRAIAQILAGQCQAPSEFAARYGGEEFALVLPGSDLESASARAERFRADVESMRLPHGRSEAAPWVTVSVGVATLPARSEDGDGLIRAADASLFDAKRAGRNQVAVCDHVAGGPSNPVEAQVPAARRVPATVSTAVTR